MNDKTTSNRHAFTLVELLLVIAVIVIIAALLLPVLSAAKSRAQRTACLNNLRQINLGVRMYCDDSNDAAPNSGGGMATNSFLPYFGYKQLMKEYVGLKGASSPKDRIFICPADVFVANFLITNRTPGYANISMHELPGFDYSSYSFNGSDNTPHQYGKTNRFSVTLPGLTGLKLSSVKHPARTVLICEAAAIFPWSWHRPQQPDLRKGAMTYNNSQDVVSFVDGHVDYTRIYLNSTMRYPNGGLSFSFCYDPPDSYDYQWSAN